MNIEESNELKLLGNRLRKIRLEKNLSQEKLAELANLDRTYISGLERGKRNPSFLILKRLSLILEVNPDCFFMEAV